MLKGIDTAQRCAFGDTIVCTTIDLDVQEFKASSRETTSSKPIVIFSQTSKQITSEERGKRDYCVKNFSVNTYHATI